MMLSVTVSLRVMVLVRIQTFEATLLQKCMSNPKISKTTHESILQNFINIVCLTLHRSYLKRKQFQRKRFMF